MTASFPRLLVAAEFSPNSPGGGPAVVRQMLRDWPTDKLFWWSVRPGSDPANGLRVQAHAIAAIPEKLYPKNRWCAQKSWLLENAWTPWAAGHFKKTLKQHNPEVVWVIPHNWSIPPLARALPSAGVAFHVTVQDYMDSLASLAHFGRERCQRLVARVESLYAAAHTRDATSHPMLDDLLARTKQPGAQMLHAGLEPAEFAALRSPENDPRPGDRIRIGYAGTIQVPGDFEFFVTVLGKIRGQLPRPVSLEFFGNHRYQSRSWFDATWMNEHGNLPAEALGAALRKCTWGFAPMALTDDDPRYNRFSFPTKFIVYLGAGLPVITLGHAESSVAKMAAAYQVGLCSHAVDPDDLASQLVTALSEPNPGAKYRDAIRRCAETEFDARRMREILYDCLRKSALVSGPAKS